jgi:uncharacterized protein DUF2842
MQARTRKLVGTVLLLIFLAIYVAAAVTIGATHIVAAPAWVEFAYFLAAGLLWVIPAGLLIRWMQRPDAPLKRCSRAGSGSTAQTALRKDRARCR